jgi:hypothetical protein
VQRSACPAETSTDLDIAYGGAWLARPAGASWSGRAAGGRAGAGAAKLRYQQTKIEQGPNTLLVDAEVVAIIREQQRWADEHLSPRWAPGVKPKYLFLAHKMNRHADKPYTIERIHIIVGELARRLDIGTRRAAAASLGACRCAIRVSPGTATLRGGAGPRPR